MKNGGWHQVTHGTQNLVHDLLGEGIGSGVIIGPRYLALDTLSGHARRYLEAGAEVWFDPEMYVPGFSKDHYNQYSSSVMRMPLPDLLQRVADTNFLEAVEKALIVDNSQLGSTALVAPAVPLESARPEIQQLNQHLFSAARSAANKLELPVIASVAMGRSITDPLIAARELAISTSFDPDGWLFQFESSDDRLPIDIDWLCAFGVSSLILASTNKPLVHNSVGPLGLLSIPVGASAAAITYAQNCWGFKRSRWPLVVEKQRGGNGGAPRRFFSGSLWGTVVHPDETKKIRDAGLFDKIYTDSPYSDLVKNSPEADWTHAESRRHFVHNVISEIEKQKLLTSREAAAHVLALLKEAVQRHNLIAQKQVPLKDGTNEYQANWHNSLAHLLKNYQIDYEWIELAGT